MRRNDRKARPKDGSAAGRGLPTIVAFCVLISSAPAFADVPNPLLPRNLSPWGMFLHADIVVKVVMIGLAFASLVTWTVWLAKAIELRSAKKRARRRLKMLERGGGLLAAIQTCEGKRDAVAQLILSAGREAELSDGIVDDGFKERVELRLERVEAAMTRQVSRGVGVLATIGAIAPFIRADKTLSYGRLMAVMNVLRDSGYLKLALVGLQTEPAKP